MATTSNWWVKRKGQSNLGPMTHRVARRAALEIARDGGEVPELQQRVQGKAKRTHRPRFPELTRSR